MQSFTGTDPGPSSILTCFTPSCPQINRWAAPTLKGTSGVGAFSQPPALDHSPHYMHMQALCLRCAGI